MAKSTTTTTTTTTSQPAPAVKPARKSKAKRVTYAALPADCRPGSAREAVRDYLMASKIKGGETRAEIEAALGKALGGKTAVKPLRWLVALGQIRHVGQRYGRPAMFDADVVATVVMPARLAAWHAARAARLAAAE